LFATWGRKSMNWASQSAVACTAWLGAVVARTRIE